MCSNCIRAAVREVATRSFYQNVEDVYRRSGNGDGGGDVFVSAWERLNAWADASRGSPLDVDAAEAEVSAFVVGAAKGFADDADKAQLGRAARSLLSALRMQTPTFGDDGDYDRALANAHPDVLKKQVDKERGGRPYPSAAELREWDRIDFGIGEEEE